jgi:hypothetical protein
MPERTIKRRLQDCDTALASDDGPYLLDRCQAGRGAEALPPSRFGKRRAEIRIHFRHLIMLNKKPRKERS